MKRALLLVFLLIIVFLPVDSAPASEKARIFMEGLDAYEKADYELAAKAFTRLADSGIINAKLYYNLGNAYLKQADIGRSLLWYERAIKRMPGDPDLIFNRDYALSLTRDEPVDEDGRLASVLFFWKYQLSRQTVQWTALILNAFFWVILGLNTFVKKRMLRIGLPIVCALSMVFCMTALFNFYEDVSTREAIILPEQVSIRSGFGEKATELFELHAGSKVKIQKMRDDHFQIRFSKDKMGWIEASNLGIIE